MLIPGKNDVKTMRPVLAEQWDYEKNKPDIPENYTMSSKEIVWWKCEHGHSWLAMIGNRCKYEGCPTCKNIKKYIRRLV